MSDASTAALPGSYAGVRKLQREFDRYQRSAFPERSARFFCLELCGEAGELANVEKKAWKGRDVPASSFVDEAADVMIALFNYANARDLDLAAAVEAKMAEIDRRRREHGAGTSAQ